MKDWLREHWLPTTIALVIAVIFATGAPWWFSFFSDDNDDSQGVPGIVAFTGGCDPYRVYAQKRWDPVGAIKLSAPDRLSNKVGGYSPNEVISVDGWVHGSVAYPNNRPPYNSDVWFHTTDGLGWVSFGGVRELPTTFDPTGLEDGGPPAPTPERCHGAVR